MSHFNNNCFGSSNEQQEKGTTFNDENTNEKALTEKNDEKTDEQALAVKNDRDKLYDKQLALAKDGDKGAMLWIGDFHFDNKSSAAIEWYEKATETEEVGEASLRLGLCYEFGIGDVKKDDNRAFGHYKNAADQNISISDSHYRLGLCYLNGRGVERNPQEAVKCFEKAVADEDECEAAYFELGVCFMNGDGVEQDFGRASKHFGMVSTNPKAKENQAECAYQQGLGLHWGQALPWFTTAADLGHDMAQMALGEIYAKGSVQVEQDWDKALEYFQKAADQGITSALREMGYCYEHGKKDSDMALKFYQQAAQKNDDDAQVWLAKHYFRGPEIAVDWLRKAASSGNSEAKYQLALCYLQGMGVKPNLFTAMDYIDEAANRGHAGAHYYLGLEVSFTPEEAVQHFRFAAAQRHADAQHKLGQCYYNGWGIDEDKTKAVQCYQKAADQGHGGAKYDLGLCYLLGIGCNKDLTLASRFLNSEEAQEYAKTQLPPMFGSPRSGEPNINFPVKSACSVPIAPTKASAYLHIPMGANVRATQHSHEHTSLDTAPAHVYCGDVSNLKGDLAIADLEALGNQLSSPFSIITQFHIITE